MKGDGHKSLVADYFKPPVQLEPVPFKIEIGESFQSSTEEVTNKQAAIVEMYQDTATVKAEIILGFEASGSGKWLQ